MIELSSVVVSWPFLVIKWPSLVTGYLYVVIEWSSLVIELPCIVVGAVFMCRIECLRSPSFTLRQRIGAGYTSHIFVHIPIYVCEYLNEFIPVYLHIYMLLYLVYVNSTRLQQPIQVLPVANY